ncbi:histidine kinase N-terminal 7TM domain-containing protein [Halovenus rubra]|uniref:histidine kinase n=2 Tax=Halovenus rubra TaxID=869890 RepID=A0ABD5XCY9_9EURY|nr:histidine kinase N-terminal 7TM domain-containing protein [Halovenus rubra]
MVASFYLPLMLLAAVVGIGFATFAWVKRNNRGETALVVFLVSASLWALAEGLTVAVGQLDTMLFWRRVGHSLSVVVPVAWLVFALGYTGARQRIGRVFFGALLIEPAAFIWLVWTNDAHETVWSSTNIIPVGDGLNVLTMEFELAFWGHQVYSYLLLTVGMVLVLRLVMRANKDVRLQGTVLLTAITVAGTLNAINLFGPLSPNLNPAGVGYTFAGLIIAVVVLEPEFARVAPVMRDAGREALLSELDDAILILDDDEYVIDLNPAARELFDAEDALGHQLATVSQTLSQRLDGSAEQGTIKLDRDGKRRTFDLRVSTLSGAYETLSGRVVSLRDVTERRQRDQRLDVLNRLLRHNIRNELNVVRGKIELAKMASEDEPETLSDAIETLDGVVARSDKVGRLSRLLDAEETGSLDIATELREQYTSNTQNYPDGKIAVDLPEELSVSGGVWLVSAFDELVTNALDHNNSDDPFVEVSTDEASSDDSHVVITITDNGPGINEQEIDTIGKGRETPLNHSSGVGLWLVHWLVQRAGGTLSFVNTDSGCTVRVRLPREPSP